MPPRLPALPRPLRRGPLPALVLALAAGPAFPQEPPGAPALDVPVLVEEMVAPLLEAEIVVGLVAGALVEDQVCVRGFGRLSRSDPRVPDGETVFEIGSISKVYTGLLLADSVARGLVALDDPVSALLPEGVEMPVFEEERPIALVHLATHGSGLPRMPRNFKPADPSSPYADYHPEELYAGLGRLRLRRGPGEEYAYSNLGVGLLGHALGLANETPFAELLVERLCEPLGLADTRVDLTASMRERLARGYDVDGREQPLWDMDVFAGAGAIRSSVNDLLLFARAQLDPQDTPLADAIALSRKKHFEPGGGHDGMGLGWHFGSGGATIWHNGQTGGYHSWLALHPERRVAVAVLATTSSGLVDRAADRLFVNLLGKEVEPLGVRRAIEVDREVLEDYVGRYRLGVMAVFDVTLEPQGLFAKLTLQDAFRIYPSAEDRFFYRVVEAEITFVRDEEGVVKALILHQNGADRRAEKLE